MLRLNAIMKVIKRFQYIPTVALGVLFSCIIESFVTENRNKTLLKHIRLPFRSLVGNTIEFISSARSVIQRNDYVQSSKQNVISVPIYSARYSLPRRLCCYSKCVNSTPHGINSRYYRHIRGICVPKFIIANQALTHRNLLNYFMI